MKKFSNQKGAITLFVVVSMLFMLIAFINIYFIASNRAQTQAELARQTEGIYLKDASMANDIYNSYFAGDVVPIYTVSQLFKIASDDYVIVNEEGGKIYHFAANTTYVLKNNLEFSAQELNLSQDWITIEEQIRRGILGGKLEWSGHVIIETNLAGIKTVYSKTPAVEVIIEPEQTEYTFAYATEGVQEFITPVTGYYQLEVWGAQRRRR